MPYVTTNISRASFISDPESVSLLGGGRQINWDNVSTTNADGKKHLPAGTVIGTALNTGANAGKVSPRVVTTNPAIGILLTSATQGNPAEALTGYGILVGGVLYENLLPDASGSPATLATAIKTELNNAGVGFMFEQYGDSRT